jgi:hypothetical protein
MSCELMSSVVTAGDDSAPSHCFCSDVQDFEEMSIAEIMSGKGSYFPGTSGLPEDVHENDVKTNDRAITIPRVAM